MRFFLLIFFIKDTKCILHVAQIVSCLQTQQQQCMNASIYVSIIIADSQDYIS